MTNSTDLDNYLAGLGISDADDDTVSPTPTPSSTGPSLNAPTLPSHSPASSDPGAASHASDPETALNAFLVGLARRFDPSLSVKVRREGDFLRGEIVGEGDLGRLIGRDGHVIEALDTLAYAVVSKHNAARGTGRHLRVRVDVGGYRERHFEQLRALAQRAAESVAASGKPHTFQPMNAADRRVIHVALQDNPHVVTQSVGEGTGRRLMIEPAPAK